MKGTLFIVSTPIGNLEDITFRALRALREVDCIAAEDIRHSLKLLTHYGIKKPMISYWSGKEKVRAEEIIDKLLSGHSVALISDAGTPGISDPGGVVVKKAIEERIQIVPVPGPSAAITALSVSGLPTDNFSFIGFLPPKKNQRQKMLRELVSEAGTLIFYEAPHRLLESLADMDQIFAGRAAAVTKELTKIHEEIFRGTLSDIMLQLEKTALLGEYVILVEGRKNVRKTADNDAVEEVLLLMKKGLKRKEAAGRIAEAYGLSKKELYDKSLDFFGTEQ